MKYEIGDTLEIKGLKGTWREGQRGVVEVERVTGGAIYWKLLEGEIVGASIIGKSGFVLYFYDMNDYTIEKL